MPLNQKTPAQFLSDSVAAFAAATGADPNLAEGSTTLGLFEGKVAGGDLFLQSQANSCYLFARASTCEGADLDSWFAQFNFTRNAPTQADGEVTFSLAGINSQNILIPVGTLIETADGSITYAVIANTSQSAWNVASNAYVIEAGNTTAVVSVQALTAGSSSNVSIGALNTLSSTVPSISSVSNLASITNGKDAETDDAARARFILFFNSRARAVTFAYIELIQSLQLNIQSISILENRNPSNNLQYGYVTIVVDDGSGATPSGSIAAINAVIDQVRACGVQVYVVAASPLLANVVINLKLASTAVGTVTQVAVAQAITNYINSLPIGTPLSFSKIFQIAFNTDPVNVIDVQLGSMTINSEQSDLTPTSLQVVRTNISLVNVGTFT